VVFSPTLRGLVVLTVAATPSVLSSQFSNTPCGGSFFSHYLSGPACSGRGLPTRLLWARCSRGIRYTRRALVVVLTNALQGLVVRIGVGACSTGLQVQKGRSVKRDNMPLISIVLQYYRLYALHHTILPPWGSHLLKPPNRKFAPARRKQKARFV